MSAYRGEIDGLRALAVLPVMFFHAGYQLFQGGYVGVDVFFVISGYLITTILIGELKTSEFTFIGFYERRARRILPALFFVVGVTLLVGWFVLLPEDMEHLARSIIAVSLFGSNILFWRSSGYFEPSAELNPLLHTWSLSVEEQFYLLYPIFLLAIWRLAKRHMLVTLLFFLAVSLSLAQFFVESHPAATFYLLPTRGWELLIGALCALLTDSKYLENTNRLFRESASLLGLVLIATSIFFFSETTPFPSFYALIPTLGTGLIILFGKPGTLVGQMLSQKLLVGIGLISYSAYLWHQPVFAFARYTSPHRIQGYSYAVLIIVSLMLAYLSWRYVEAHFRNKRSVNRVQILQFSIGLTFTLLLIGTLGIYTGGFSNRIDNDKLAFLNYYENSTPRWAYFERTNYFEIYREACNYYDLDAYRDGNPTLLPRSIPTDCFSRDEEFPKSLMLWGDSHATHLYPGLRASLSQDWQIMQVTSSACKPFLVVNADASNYCEHSNRVALQTIESAKPDVVIIAQNRGHNADDLVEISLKVRELGAKQIILTGPTPHWHMDLPKLVATRLWQTDVRRTMAGIDREVLEQDEVLRETLKFTTPEVHYFSLIEVLCDTTGCLTQIGNNRTLGLTSWDSGHLTEVASKYAVERGLSKFLTR